MYKSNNNFFYLYRTNQFIQLYGDLRFISNSLYMIIHHWNLIKNQDIYNNNFM